LVSLIERSNQQEDHIVVLFNTLVSAIRDVVSPEHYSRLISPSSVSVICSGLKNSYPYLHSSVSSELIALLDEQTKKTLRHPWSVLRDFFACQMYLSVNSILIRPVIPLNSYSSTFQLRNSAFICLQHLGRWRIGAALWGGKNCPSSCFRGMGAARIGRRLFFFLKDL